MRSRHVLCSIMSVNQEGVSPCESVGLWSCQLCQDKETYLLRENCVSFFRVKRLHDHVFQVIFNHRLNFVHIHSSYNLQTQNLARSADRKCLVAHQPISKKIRHLSSCGIILRKLIDDQFRSPTVLEVSKRWSTLGWFVKNQIGKLLRSKNWLFTFSAVEKSLAPRYNLVLRNSPCKSPTLRLDSMALRLRQPTSLPLPPVYSFSRSNLLCYDQFQFFWKRSDASQLRFRNSRLTAEEKFPRKSVGFVWMSQRL